MTFSNFSKLLSRSLIGAVGVSAIALLGSPEAAKASGADCGITQGGLFQGVDWVSNCPEGVDVFPNTWAGIIIEIPAIDPNPISVKLQGPATIIREEGNNSRINTTIAEILVGIIPGIGEVTLTGEGTGAIVDDGGSEDIDNIANNGFAGSFFDVVTTINTPLGTFDTGGVAVPVVGDRALVGVSPSVIPPIPISPLTAFNPPCSEELQDLAEPSVAIAYCGTTPITLFDDQGNPAGRIVAEIHVIHPVPEPSITAGLALFGLAGLKGLKKKSSLK